MNCFQRVKGVAWRRPLRLGISGSRTSTDGISTSTVGDHPGSLRLPTVGSSLTRSWSMVSARGYFGIAMVHNALNPLNRRLEHHLTKALEPQQHHSACSKDRHALARRGPNITSQQSYVVMFLDCLCLRGLVPISPTSHLWAIASLKPDLWSATDVHP